MTFVWIDDKIKTIQIKVSKSVAIYGQGGRKKITIEVQRYCTFKFKRNLNILDLFQSMYTLRKIFCSVLINHLAI